MLGNYLLVAWRSLRKRVGPTLINVTGLAAGLAACLLIGLWIQHEQSYDDFHPDADRVYRIATDAQGGDNAIRTSQTPVPLRSALLRDVPSVEAVTQFDAQRSVVLRRDAQSFTDHTVVFADSAFFAVFGGFDLRHGDRASLLDGTDPLVLTAETAQRLFGRTDVVGETLRLDDTTRRITGVLANVPETSHLQFDAVAARAPASPDNRDNWTGFGNYTYAKLGAGASPDGFERQLQQIAEQYGVADIQESFGLPLDQISYAFVAEPLPDIYLHSPFNGPSAGGSITTVYVFAAIGLFILLIACINFMNLATARASERATEVGMRKALGAGRPQLMGQFFGEALLTTAGATGLALLLAGLALPAFNDFADTSFGLDAFLQPTVVIGILALVAVVGLIAGSYPALALSRFLPADVLKASGRHSTGGGDRRLRQGLVVFQFAISVALIVGTLVAQEQFDYIQSKRLGFDKTRVVEVEDARNLGDRQSAFLDRLRQTPGVTAVASGDPLFRGTWSNAFWPADSTARASQVLKFFRVSPRFLETMAIDLVEGRSFDPARPADSMSVIVNQAAVEAYGWDTPTQQRLAADDTSAAVYDVIGVTDNFHFQSMRQEIEPAAFFMDDVIGMTSVPGSVYARLTPGDTRAGLDRIEQAWTEVAGAGVPFQYSFLDRTYDRLHRDVQHASTLFRLFAGLAILIACLGLFGLATHTVQRRRKEIGIRKALGATVSQIVGLLSQQFLLLVGVGAVIALPAAYWAMGQWLSGFAYQTGIGVGVLGGAVLLAAVVALAAISTQALQAARLDPATTLKDE